MNTVIEIMGPRLKNSIDTITGFINQQISYQQDFTELQLISVNSGWLYQILNEKFCKKEKLTHWHIIVWQARLMLNASKLCNMWNLAMSSTEIVHCHIISLMFIK